MKKDKRVGKRAISVFALLAAGAVLLYFYYPAVLTAGGRYLAPEGKGKADVVILEGAELIKEQAVQVGIGLISSGRAQRLVVVYQHSEERALGLPSDYGLFLIQKIGDLGLKEDQIRAYPVPQEHPITLNEARIVLSKLAMDKTPKAIVLAEGFHTRRSYWTYKQAGKVMGIDILPCPYFSRFPRDLWWQKVEGVRDFLGEGMKFVYYVLRGYIPIQSLVIN